MENKILFLPHCLSESYISSAQKMAENKGYDVYVVKGGSMMKNILKGYDLASVESFVGVACEDEVDLAGVYGFKLGISERISSVKLTKAGCKDTEFDIGDLEKKLK